MDCAVIQHRLAEDARSVERMARVVERAVDEDRAAGIGDGTEVSQREAAAKVQAGAIGDRYQSGIAP